MLSYNQKLILSTDVCEDDDAVFTNKSVVSAGNLNYSWKFGDKGTSTSQSPRHRYNIGGVSKTYNVTLVAVVPGGCSDSITKAVTVNANPMQVHLHTKLAVVWLTLKLTKLVQLFTNGVLEMVEVQLKPILNITT
jgi:hypothetical protein